MSERRYETCLVHGNKHGYRGIWWDAKKQKFAAYIWPTTGQRGRFLGRFEKAEQAAQAYDAAARKVYGEDARLNFPGPGEVATIASRLGEGLCRQGHDLSEHGYRRPDGRGVTCRVCNREAAKRYYKRKSTPSPQS